MHTTAHISPHGGAATWCPHAQHNTTQHCVGQRGRGHTRKTRKTADSGNPTFESSRSSSLPLSAYWSTATPRRSASAPTETPDVVGRPAPGASAAGTRNRHSTQTVSTSKARHIAPPSPPPPPNRRQHHHHRKNCQSPNPISTAVSNPLPVNTHLGLCRQLVARLARRRQWQHRPPPRHLAWPP
jgi:hypothetical protein